MQEDSNQSMQNNKFMGKGINNSRTVTIGQVLCSTYHIHHLTKTQVAQYPSFNLKVFTKA